MSQQDNLIWIDLEMTGLDTQTDVIIEIATIVTDANLNVLAEGPEIAIYQGDEVLDLAQDLLFQLQTQQLIQVGLPNQKHHHL